MRYVLRRNAINIPRILRKGGNRMTAEDAIEIIKSRNFYCIECIDRNEKCCKALDMAIKALEKEPKTGHWITKDGKEQGYDIGGVKTWYIQIMCSECGFIKTAIEGNTGQYHYCPNCGAKMKGVENE